MTRFSIVFICALIVLSGPLTPASAAGLLTGKMAVFNYLIGGTWLCTITIPASSALPATTVHDSATFEIAPGNVVHQHVNSATTVGDDYYAFNAKTNVYWHSSAQSDGTYTWAVSQDGKTFTGSAWPGDSVVDKLRTVTTYTEVNPNRQDGRLQIYHGSGEATITGICLRAKHANSSS